MNQPTEYIPPTSQAIQERQNETDALRLLIAQRRLYSRAKRWLGVRWIGMVIIGIAAPVFSVIWPSLAVAIGAIAGAWLFFGRTLLLQAQESLTARAAALQEQFDFYVFQMPNNTKRSSLPTLEEVAAIAGPNDEIAVVATREQLLDWYPINSQESGTITVAIAQRANASYADRLLQATAALWSVATILWFVALIILTLLLDVSLSAFLLGVALPVLPAFLDVVQYIRSVGRSAEDRRDLVRAIEAGVSGGEPSVKGNDLLVWQERLFELRRSAPEVPDFLYRIRRSVNERTMHTAADQLSRRARNSN